MARSWPLYLLIVALATALISWNVVPLRNHEMHIRTSDLNFVPDPALGRILNLGQNGAASKLRWIDSFTYFELQLDKRNDTLRGSRQSGFERLYNLLTAEDPYYIPFYEHASFNIGALTSRHDLALSFLLRGISYMPHATPLWRQAAAELYAAYDFDKNHPEQMNQFLDAWADNELDYIQRRQVWDWKNAMARRHDMGLSQLAYWQEQARHYQKDSPAGIYIDQAMHEEAAHFCLRELDALISDYHATHVMAPVSLNDALDLDVVRRRYPHGLNPYLPIAISDHRLVLRSDPFGYPFCLVDGKALSTGLQKHIFATYDGQLVAKIHRYLDDHPHASFPEDLATVRALNIDVPALSPLAHCRFDAKNQSISLTWDPPTDPPWDFSQDLEFTKF